MQSDINVQYLQRKTERSGNTISADKEGDSKEQHCGTGAEDALHLRFCSIVQEMGEEWRWSVDDGRYQRLCNQRRTN